MVSTDYKLHELTQACICKELLFRGDNELIKHDQYFRYMATKYNQDVLRETFKFALEKVNIKRPAYKWGYFKKIFETEIERIANELPAAKEEVIKQETETELEPYKLFAQCIGADVFMSCVKNGADGMLIYSDADYKTIDNIKSGTVAPDECEQWIKKMRKLGFGRYYDELIAQEGGRQ